MIACQRALFDIPEDSVTGRGKSQTREKVIAAKVQVVTKGLTKVRAAQTERSTARHELSRLQQALANTTATVTPEIVRQTLAEFTTLLEQGRILGAQ